MSALTDLYEAAKAGKQLQCLSRSGKRADITLEGLEGYAKQYYRVKPKTVEVHIYRSQVFPGEMRADTDPSMKSHGGYIKTIVVELEDL